MHRYVLSIAYDGSDLAGWWRQPGRRTVAGVFDKAFRQLGESGAEAIGVARTDSGVHARGQLAQVDCERSWNAEELAPKLNAQLPEDVVVTQAIKVPISYQLRDHIYGKVYAYRFDLGSTRNPFLARTSWRPPLNPLPSIEYLQQLSAACIGERDWRGLARRGDHRDDHHCHIRSITWEDNGIERRCIITGNRFTYRLVRSLTAVLWAVARGNVSLDEFNDCLQGSVNNCAQHQAPARGLCLEQVLWEPPQAS